MMVFSTVSVLQQVPFGLVNAAWLTTTALLCPHANSLTPFNHSAVTLCKGKTRFSSESNFCQVLLFSHSSQALDMPRMPSKQITSQHSVLLSFPSPHATYLISVVHSKCLSHILHTSWTKLSFSWLVQPHTHGNGYINNPEGCSL